MQYSLTENESSLKGIYQITNLINGDFYIGSTKRTFYKRYADYRSAYKRYKEGRIRSFHPYLFNAFNKYGYENFSFKLVISIDKNAEEIKRVEETYIKELKPVYNICQKPSRGGSPNLGRKLSEEWKERISQKSKLYRHSDDKEILKKVTQKNKDTSSLYRIWKDEIEFSGSLIECSHFVNSSIVQLLKWLEGTYKSKKGWKIEKLRSQKKKIKVFFKNTVKTFNSFGECDRYLNMWRGYTSTKTLRNENLLNEYEYEIIEDIV